MASQFDKQVLFIFSAVLIVALAGSIWTINSTNVGYFALNDACPLGTNSDGSCINAVFCQNNADSTDTNDNIVYQYDPATYGLRMSFKTNEPIQYFLSADDLKENSQTFVYIEGPSISQGQRFIVMNDDIYERILTYKSFDPNTNVATFYDVVEGNVTANVTRFTGRDATTGYYGRGTLKVPIKDGKDLILDFVVNGLYQIDGDLNHNGKFHEIIEIPLYLLGGGISSVSELRNGCPPASPANTYLNSCGHDLFLVYSTVNGAQTNVVFKNPEGLKLDIPLWENLSDFVYYNNGKYKAPTYTEGVPIGVNSLFIISTDTVTRFLSYADYDRNTKIITLTDSLTGDLQATVGSDNVGQFEIAGKNILFEFNPADETFVVDLNGDNVIGTNNVPLRLEDGSTVDISTLKNGCPPRQSACYTRITNITFNPANPNPAYQLHITPDDKVELAFQISTPVINSGKFYESAFKYTVVDPDGLQVNAPDYPDGMTENNYDYQGNIGTDANSDAKWVGVYLGHMRSDNSLGHMKAGNYTITLFGFPFMSDIDPNGYYTSGCDGVTNESNYDSWKIVVDIFGNLPNPPILDITPIPTPFEVTHATTSVPYPTTPATPPITGCTDTDGNNQYTAGTVTLDNGNNGVDTCLSITPPTLSSPVTVTGVDSCSGPNCYVDEKICVVGGNGIADVGGQHIQCADGCNAGVCATSTTPTGPTGIIISSITSVGQNIADGVLEHGLDFKFVVTLPTGENQLTARFNDWKVNGAPAFATFNNTFISYKGVQYKVDSQSDYGLSDTVAVTDEDANAAGIQTIFDVLARIPVNTTAGNFTSSFRLRSLPAGGA